MYRCIVAACLSYVLYLLRAVYYTPASPSSPSDLAAEVHASELLLHLLAAHRRRRLRRLHGLGHGLGHGDGQRRAFLPLLAPAVRVGEGRERADRERARDGHADLRADAEGEAVAAASVRAGVGAGDAGEGGGRALLLLRVIVDLLLLGRDLLLLRSELLIGHGRLRRLRRLGARVEVDRVHRHGVGAELVDAAAADAAIRQRRERGRIEPGRLVAQLETLADDGVVGVEAERLAALHLDVGGGHARLVAEPAVIAVLPALDRCLAVRAHTGGGGADAEPVPVAGGVRLEAEVSEAQVAAVGVAAEGERAVLAGRVVLPRRVRPAVVLDAHAELRGDADGADLSGAGRVEVDRGARRGGGGLGV